MKQCLVEFKVRVVVPFDDQYANKEHIEFRFNEGTWSALNLIDWLDAMEPSSLEESVTAIYLREATQEEAEKFSIDAYEPEKLPQLNRHSGRWILHPSRCSHLPADVEVQQGKRSGLPALDGR